MSALSFASTVILTGVVVCGVAKAQSTPDPSASDKMAYWSMQRRGANYGPVRLRPADLQAAVNAGIDFLRLRDSLRSTSRDFLIGDADRYQGINKGRFAYPDRMPAGNDSTAVWNIEKLRAIVEPVRAFAARYDVPKHRIISSEFWCDRRVDGAALYLADEMRIYNELGWHWAFYGFRGEGAWTGLDYEIPLDARIAHLWDAEKRGEDLEPLKPRRDNPVWAVIQRELIAGSPTATAPVFTDVFRSGAEGYASIRIPAVLVTKTGTVLAFAEGRRRPADQAENDIVMKRSTDGGKNWSSLRVLHDDGAHSLNNPTVVQEQVSGRIFVWYQRIPSHLKERSQSTATGLEGPDIYRNLILTSDDDGATWSTPQDVTATTKRPERATTIASGPGIGIQLTRGPHRGRLIIPFNEGPYGVWQNYAVFSDDAGKTWRFGADVPGALIPDGKGGHRSRINEAQVAELSDGSVRLDSRQFAGATVRKTAVSRDGGATWSPAAELPEVTDPSCMAGLLRYSFDDAAGRGRLLHTGPDSTKRERGTVWLSLDDGATWPVKRVLWPGAFAYSVPTRLADGTVGVLFEADDYRRIVFARFPIAWIEKGYSQKKLPGVVPVAIETSAGAIEGARSDACPRHGRQLPQIRRPEDVRRRPIPPRRAAGQSDPEGREDRGRAGGARSGARKDGAGLRADSPGAHVGHRPAPRGRGPLDGPHRAGHSNLRLFHLRGRSALARLRRSEEQRRPGLCRLRPRDGGDGRGAEDSCRRHRRPRAPGPAGRDPARAPEIKSEGVPDE